MRTMHLRNLGVAGSAAALLALLATLAIAAGAGWALGTTLAPSQARTETPDPEAAPLDSDDAVVVHMTNALTFEPKTIEIRVGQTVRWENAGALPHTVTADPGKAGNPDLVRLPEGAAPFDSGLLMDGATFSHTFTVPGEYRYFCIPHAAASMAGTVIVRP